MARTTKKEETLQTLENTSPNIQSLEVGVSSTIDFIKDVGTKSSDAQARKLREVITGMTEDDQMTVAMSINPEIIAEVNKRNVANMLEDIHQIKSLKWRTK